MDVSCSLASLLSISRYCFSVALFSYFEHVGQIMELTLPRKRRIIDLVISSYYSVNKSFLPVLVSLTQPLTVTCHSLLPPALSASIPQSVRSVGTESSLVLFTVSHSHQRSSCIIINVKYQISADPIGSMTYYSYSRNSIIYRVWESPT